MEQGLLQYKDLKEFEFKYWDGKPFLAFYTDFTTEFVVNAPDGEPVRPAAQVIGYTTYNGNQFWKLDTDVHWQHVYRVEDNEHFFCKRLTYRQLSRWLAAGKGEFLNTETHYVSSRSFYEYSKSNEQVPTNLLVRTWDSEEWVQPTTKVLKELKMTLIRIKDYGETVMGVMFDTDKKFGTYYTLERKSKLIPVGLYDLDLTYSPKFKKELPLVHNTLVPENRGIRIHAGNTVDDTEGCILIGNISSLAERRIWESNIAVNQLVSAMKGKTVKLIIRDVQSIEQ